MHGFGCKRPINTQTKFIKIDFTKYSINYIRICKYAAVARDFEKYTRAVNKDKGKLKRCSSQIYKDMRSYS